MNVKRSLKSATGTKSISSQKSDPLFDAFQERIEREQCVQLWSYEIEKNVAIVTIHFNDGEKKLDFRVNPYDVQALKRAMETLDGFFISKLERC